MFEKYYSLQRENYGVEERWLRKPERLDVGEVR
jgi:formylmethanofuran dehydrogenase subunit A